MDYSTHNTPSRASQDLGQASVSVYDILIKPGLIVLCFLGIVLLLSLFFTTPALAQSSTLKAKVLHLDSLITIRSRFDIAQSATDSLNQELLLADKSTENIALELQVRLLQAILYARNNQNHKAFKISLSVIDDATKHRIPEKAYQACLFVALMYEEADKLDRCKQYLDKALALYKAYRIDYLYSVYCIRTASYYRFKKQYHEARIYAHKALQYAVTYKNVREHRDAYLLLGMLTPEDQYEQSIYYFRKCAEQFKAIEDYKGAAIVYGNIGAIYHKHHQPTIAMQYNDTALQLTALSSLPDQGVVFEQRANFYQYMGVADSALFYYKKYHEAHIQRLVEQEKTEINRIAEQHENDQKERIISNKNHQLYLILCLMVVIATSAILLYRKNREIKTQHQLILVQVDALEQVVTQKQYLLSELQHRVKNNLQHVISILELQKESATYHNIEELIRGNQNRIHSIALLHKRMQVTEKVNEVNVEHYLKELITLVIDSYYRESQQIQYHINNSVATLSIDQTLPLGLIIVELLSNSIKHAFNHNTHGEISLDMHLEAAHSMYLLQYQDNGIGFDFNTTHNNGLGLEIIKGLIDQLHGTVTVLTHNGFGLQIRFPAT
jgi:two-component sensor histidine kinase